MQYCGLSGRILFQHTAARRRLDSSDGGRLFITCFNTQPPEGGWEIFRFHLSFSNVSTHSRPKAAGFDAAELRLKQIVSTHSRPKAAGVWVGIGIVDLQVSTHSRPKAAGNTRRIKVIAKMVSTHSRPKAAGSFAHVVYRVKRVSTHSRPKAAGTPSIDAANNTFCFNTQPPEGGWLDYQDWLRTYTKFQHTAARRRLGF